MSDTYNALSDRAEWAELDLKDYGDYSDCVEYVNQEDDYDSMCGKWFYDDADNLVIYWGTFGNYNSPGADSCTYAEVCEDREEFDKLLAKWESLPEYIETDDDTDDDDCDDDTDDAPSEDDYIVTDSGCLGGKTSVSQSGRFLQEFINIDQALEFIGNRMEEEQFYPSIYYVSDHGNTWPIDLEGKAIK